MSVKTDIQKVVSGNLFTESSQYEFLRSVKTFQLNTMVFKHLHSGEEVQISPEYVAKYLSPADQYAEEVVVGKEDKYWTANQISKLEENPDNLRAGDLKQEGIRSLFLEIPKEHIFTVTFETAPKDIGAGNFKSSLLEQRAELLKRFDEAYSRKKEDNLNLVEAILEGLQANRIERTEIHERVLRGFKVQNHSASGVYDCVDLDIEEDHNMRKVRLTAISSLIVDNVKYIVK